MRIPTRHLARLLAMYEEQSRTVKKGIHPTAVIEESAVIGKDVYIGAHVYVSDKAVIGDGCSVYPNVFIGDNVRDWQELYLSSGGEGVQGLSHREQLYHPWGRGDWLRRVRFRTCR
ncbi:MAG: hypothetical protein MZV63_42865 [Marinilabiliales bacterium]|nr:hypothetical protein [Marinilabiliales bacterium]